MLMQNNGHTTFLLFMEVPAEGLLCQCPLYAGKQNSVLTAEIQIRNRRVVGVQIPLTKRKFIVFSPSAVACLRNKAVFVLFIAR